MSKLTDHILCSHSSTQEQKIENWFLALLFASVAHSVEQRIRNAQVVGSSPTRSSKNSRYHDDSGSFSISEKLELLLLRYSEAAAQGYGPGLQPLSELADINGFEKLRCHAISNQKEY